MKLTIFIKRIINQIIKKFGYSLIGKKQTIKHNDFDAIIKFLSKDICKMENLVIFDVGANVGQSIDRFSKLFKNDKNEIFSFEPIPEIFETLKKEYDTNNLRKNIRLFQLALDNKAGKSKMHSYKYHQINSLIPTDKGSKFHKSREIISKDNFEPFETEVEIETNTIDNIAMEQRIDKIDILKIDTQGNEDRILEGSKKLLNSNKIGIIELELILGFGYKKQMSFHDIEKVLSPCGYRLIAIDYASNVISFSNYQVNVIYVNADIFHKIKHLHYENKTIENITNRTDNQNPFSY